MLKKVPVHLLRKGVHLHKLEGPWIFHPFWKTRFVIDSDQDLARLHGCGVAEAWIDVALGLDVTPDPTLGSPPQAAAPALAPVATQAQRPAPASVSLDEELRQAAAIISRGRLAVTAMFAEARMGRVADAEGLRPLVDEIASSVQRNAGALVSLARLKSADDYSYMHSVAVCALMVALAHQFGMDDRACREAGAAGLMHDIGKALMPPEILAKPGRLDESEFALIRTHPQRGHDLLAEADKAAPTTLDVVLHHHERVDGAGYPDRLEGEAISTLSRMGAICDVYDAITSDRPYKAGWDPAESIVRMAGWKGHFDPVLLGMFVRGLGIYPVGSVVRLKSGRLAVVVEQNPQAPMTPVVKTYFSTRSQMPLNPERIDLLRSADHIVGREGGAVRQPHLDELWADPEVLARMKR